MRAEPARAMHTLTRHQPVPRHAQSPNEKARAATGPAVLLRICTHSTWPSSTKTWKLNNHGRAQEWERQEWDGPACRTGALGVHHAHAKQPRTRTARFHVSCFQTRSTTPDASSKLGAAAGAWVYVVQDEAWEGRRRPGGRAAPPGSRRYCAGAAARGRAGRQRQPHPGRPPGARGAGRL